MKRLKTGKSLNKFAIEFDIEPAILSRIENDKQDVKLKVLNKIAEGFGMSAGKFLTEFEKS
jgi:transcriptional regulator with XRE-family HTH domain